MAVGEVSSRHVQHASPCSWGFLSVGMLGFAFAGPAVRPPPWFRPVR
ncbi:MAG TPA: hypothetical protein VFE12_18405 [Acetobacteraceae bacterium]|nr:hypothetical protein [Acetobacteraceae bacterium]